MPLHLKKSELNFRLRKETIERCEIFSLTPDRERRFRAVSSELFHFLYDVPKVNFAIYLRIDRTMIEFIKPTEFSPELLDQLWKTMKKSGHRLEINILKSEFVRFTETIDRVRQAKLDKLVGSHPGMDPKTIAIFQNLSGASQLVVKGGVTSDVVDQIRASAAYLMSNLIDSTEALSTLSRMVIHDPTLYDHSASVAIFSGLIAKECLRKPLPVKEQELIAQCGLYHDIGKTCVPTAILNKPGRFTPEEFEVMKNHTTMGEQELLDQIKCGVDIDLVAARVAGEHHERFQGHGYPRGKKGCLEDSQEHGIHLYSRIVAIADVYSALLMKRVYKPAYEAQDAIKIMAENAERDFDPNIFDKFLRQVVTSLNWEQEHRKMKGKGRILYFDEEGQLAEKSE